MSHLCLVLVGAVKKKRKKKEREKIYRIEIFDFFVLFKGTLFLLFSVLPYPFDDTIKETKQKNWFIVYCFDFDFRHSRFPMCLIDALRRDVRNSSHFFVV